VSKALSRRFLAQKTCVEKTGSIHFIAGTFRINRDYQLQDDLLDLVLGASHIIDPLRHLAVAGKTIIETPVYVEGGTFSAGSLVRGSPLFFDAGTLNLTNDNFTVGSTGLFGDTLALASRNVNITKTAGLNRCPVSERTRR
jgi:hypothetical protein